MGSNGSLIAVFGATGYTGRLVAEALRQRELPMPLAERDARKRGALTAQLGGAETMVANVDDRASCAEPTATAGAQA